MAGRRNFAAGLVAIEGISIRKGQKIRRQEEQGIGFSFSLISAHEMSEAVTGDYMESLGPAALEGRQRCGDGDRRSQVAFGR